MTVEAIPFPYRQQQRWALAFSMPLAAAGSCQACWPASTHLFHPTFLNEWFSRSDLGGRLLRNFAQLVSISAMARLLFSGTTCLAVLVLGRKRPQGARKFSIPGGSVISILAAMSSLRLLTGITGTPALAGMIGLLLGALSSTFSYQ